MSLSSSTDNLSTSFSACPADDGSSSSDSGCWAAPSHAPVPCRPREGKSRLSSMKRAPRNLMKSFTKSSPASLGSSRAVTSSGSGRATGTFNLSDVAALVTEEFEAETAGGGPHCDDESASENAGKQRLEERFAFEASVLDRSKLDSIPTFSRSEVTIGKFLGKGSFSDVFEVSINLPAFGNSMTTQLLMKGTSDLDNIQESPAPAGNDAERNYSRTASLDPPSDNRRRPRRRRPAGGALSRSMIPSSSAHQSTAILDRKVTAAMKCLSPNIRANPSMFLIGAEDLAHETAVLASLEHPNIIKLYGRASGDLTDALKMNDNYFILIEKLDESLDHRLNDWKKEFGKKGACHPDTTRLNTARSVADALAYLHSKRICFRDLKPGNVGFDSSGIVKLFDFGFAVGVPLPDEDDDSPPLEDKCGTPRYMAPEVGLERGYDMNVDQYSFGILLWEICSVKKPYRKLKTIEDIEKEVYLRGNRPPLEKCWSTSLNDLMASCWSADPDERPSMANVKSVMHAIAREAAEAKTEEGEEGLSNPRPSFMKRFSL